MEKTAAVEKSGGPVRRRKWNMYFWVPFCIAAFIWFKGFYQFVHGTGHGDNAKETNNVFGRFPTPDDPFHFQPCTSRTIPPSLKDDNPDQAWARLFDPDPTHWNWGKQTTATDASEDSDETYGGRGIYLCGYIDVPMDFTNNSDPRIFRLAVTKFQVSGLARSDGKSAPSAGRKSERTLVVEPGGPGGSGTGQVWRAAEELTQRFTKGQYDVLGWDPRGVNLTQPAVSCFPYDVDRDRWSLLTGQYLEVSPSPRLQLELVDAMNDAIFRACLEIHGDLPRFLSTALVARELEEIRAALAEDELTAYFVSYGTGIGQTYVNMFPDSVGRVILDGTEYVRDHRELAGFGWTALDNATDAWHDGFLGECINAGPDHCALARSRYGRSVTLEDLEARMERLVKSTINRPIMGYASSSGPSLVTYSALVESIYGALYNAQAWPALAQMLYELEEGNSTLATIFLESSSWKYDPTLPCAPYHAPFSEDALAVMVICSDSYDAPQPEEGLDWWGSLWHNMTAQAWISGNSRFFIVFPCHRFNNYWPQPAEVYRGNLNNTLKNPILLIAETYDPATPLRNGRRLLQEMGPNARLVAHHGYGHSSRDLSNCTITIGQALLLNGTLPDEAETECYANGKPYLDAAEDNPVYLMSSGAWDPVEAWRKHIERR